MKVISIEILILGDEDGYISYRIIDFICKKIAPYLKENHPELLK